MKIIEFDDDGNPRQRAGSGRAAEPAPRRLEPRVERGMKIVEYGGEAEDGARAAAPEVGRIKIREFAPAASEPPGRAAPPASPPATMKVRDFGLRAGARDDDAPGRSGRLPGGMKIVESE